MKTIQLSLKKNWFEMTASEVKKEDYRDITPYWCCRFLLWDDKAQSKYKWYEKLCSGEHSSEQIIIKYIEKGFITFKSFNQNRMTLGYPSANKSSRILNIQHEGIEVRTGNPEWGAKPDKIYFVIKHGKL